MRFVKTFSIALCSLSPTSTLASNFCYGTFTSVVVGQGSGDRSGVAFTISSPNLVHVTVYEGSKEETKGRNIIIGGNRVFFEYFDKVQISGECTSKGIIGPGFNHSTGKMELRHLYRRLN